MSTHTENKVLSQDSSKHLSDNMRQLVQALVEEFQAAAQTASEGQTRVAADGIKKVTHFCVDEQRIARLMENFTSKADYQRDLAAFALFDDKQNYTRNLVWDCEYFSLIVLCWNAHNASCIHSHGGAQCWAWDVKGTLKELFYQQDHTQDMKSLEPDRVSELHAYQGVYIDDGMGIHKICNDTDEGAVSLHLYAPPFKTCAYFHPRTGKRCVSEMIFHSIDGVVQPKLVPAPSPSCCPNASVATPSPSSS